MDRKTSFENIAAKKDLTVETTVIGKFTLRFATRDLERKWQTRHLNRQRGISQRFLFMCAVFQMLFYFSEQYDVHLAVWNHADYTRWASGVLVLGACALISNSKVQPNQWFLFVVVFTYGMMTLSIFLFQRSQLCQWDSLFLVYGLVFVMLPKISPLDFVFGLTAALIYAAVFLTVSASQLSLGEWLLSSSYLLVVLLLFGYLAYTSERSSRERWLLRQRLQREHITLQLLPSSLSQDLRTHARLPSTKYRFTTVYSTPQTTEKEQPVGVPETPAIHHHAVKTRRALLIRGLVVWVAFSVFAWVFNRDFMGIPELIRSVDSNAAWALLMHTTGFSIFLLLLTRQVRWLVLNVVIALGVLWLFSHTLPANWMLFNINSLGYLVLFMVLLLVLGVAGGLVYVWTNLVDFLKSLCLRYPQVHDDLRANKLLEQVLIRHLSELPRPELLQSYSDLHATALENGGQVVLHSNLSPDTSDNEAYVLDAGHGFSTDADTAAGKQSHQNITSQPGWKGNQRSGHSSTGSKGTGLHQVMQSRAGKGRCIFCLQDSVVYYLPVCKGWQPDKKDQEHGECKSNENNRMSMCTYFASLLQERDTLKKDLASQREQRAFLESDLESVYCVIQKQESELRSLKRQKKEAVEAVLKTERQKQEVISQDLASRVNQMAREHKQMGRQLNKYKDEITLLEQEKSALQHEIEYFNSQSRRATQPKESMHCATLQSSADVNLEKASSRSNSIASSYSSPSSWPDLQIPQIILASLQEQKAGQNSLRNEATCDRKLKHDHEGDISGGDPPLQSKVQPFKFQPQISECATLHKASKGHMYPYAQDQPIDTKENLEKSAVGDSQPAFAVVRPRRLKYAQDLEIKAIKESVQQYRQDK